MITIHGATVETLDHSQARPIGSTVLDVIIGDHVFQMVVDADELMDALDQVSGEQELFCL